MGHSLCFTMSMYAKSIRSMAEFAKRLDRASTVVLLFVRLYDYKIKVDYKTFCALPSFTYHILHT
jgi:hypothetical protein